MEFTFKTKTETKDFLREYGKNITALAKSNQLDPIIGRDEEIRRIIQILSRKTKNNPVLVGEPGVGKTAIVEGLAQKIIEGNVPENLKNKTIYEITISSLIAGASFQGEFEKRVRNVLEHVEKSQGQIILFIDEIHTVIGAGNNNNSGMDAAQILKPLLARGQIKLIGATTFDEYRKHIEKDGAMERRMQKISVQEPTSDEAIAIMRGLKKRFETFHNVRISDNALVSAVNLSLRYIQDRKLPDKAIDLIDEAAAWIKTEMNSKPEALEKLERKLALLKMEKLALVKEKDVKSFERKKNIEIAIDKYEDEKSELDKQWKDEKQLVTKVNHFKDKLEQSKANMSRLQGEGQFEKASIIKYKDIPKIEKALKIANQNVQKKSTFLVKEEVGSSEIANIVSRWTKIPIEKLVRSERERIMTLHRSLTNHIKGQNEALQIVSDAILRSKADINDPTKPIGSFIFMGPTGVGKTEVARGLARELFNNAKAIVRIDMSEYMEEHSVSRLIGPPPGYVGFDQSGQLSEAIRQKPYSIVLFDEIEKAHPKVLDLLLQILDDGHLTDSHGKQVNFKNTIIIMTTNLGSNKILNNKKLVPAEILKNYLRPEFINRIDEIVIFNSLSKEAIKQIVLKELEELAVRLNNKDYYITFNISVVDFIAREGYDLTFGARPIKRLIKSAIETKLAKDIISGNLKQEQTYELFYSDKKFRYEVAKLN